jgi:CRISPR system Cascade subunit CasE
MYFSLIAPAPDRARDAIHERLHGLYADHQWLWHWFPAERGTSRDFLFRRHEREGQPSYYVVSQRPPIVQGGAWHIQTRDYAPQLQVGERLTFDLRANPTVRHGHDGKSKRHDVVMNAKKQLLAKRGLTRWQDWKDSDRPEMQDVIQSACVQWLIRRSERLGFSIDANSVLVQAYNTHQEHQQQKDRDLQFTTVDFSGELTVTDTTIFQNALMAGIGSAKAFGCGLLLVRRVGTE